MLIKKSDLREYFSDDEFPLIEEYSYLLKNRWCGYSYQRSYEEFAEKHPEIVTKFHSVFVCIWD